MEPEPRYSIQHHMTDDVVCPHCGYGHKREPDEFTKSGEYHCWSCDAPFRLTVIVSVKYTTTK